MGRYKNPHKNHRIQKLIIVFDNIQGPNVGNYLTLVYNYLSLLTQKHAS